MSSLLKKYGIEAPAATPTPALSPVPTRMPTAKGSSLLAKYGIEERAPQAASDPGQMSLREMAFQAPGNLLEGLLQAKDRLTNGVKLPEAYLKQEEERKKGYKFPAPQVIEPSVGKNLGYLSGLVTTAGAEGVKRVKSLGQEGVGAEEWNKALEGDATSQVDWLKRAGAPGYVAWPVGLVGTALTDPMGGFPGKGLGFKEAVRAKYAPSTLDRLLQSDDIAGRVNPAGIGAALEGAGKWVYSQPWGKANRGLLKRTKNPFGSSGYSDFLWNDGKPRVGGFTKSNAEIQEEILGLADNAWAKMAEPLGEIKAMDLGPGITTARAKGGQAAVNDRLSELLERAEGRARRQATTRPRVQNPDNLPVDPDFLERLKQVEDSLGPQFNERAFSERFGAMKESIEASAQNPSSRYFQKVRQAGEDAASSRLKARLRARLAGEANERAGAIEELKKLAPDFADDIDQNATRFKTGEGADTLDWFNKLIDDVSAGPRTGVEANRLASKYGSRAHGSSNLESSTYETGTKKSTKRVQAAGTRRTIADKIEDAVEAQAEQQLKSGSRARARFDAAKKEYAVAARGEGEAVKAVQAAEARPPFTSLDYGGAGASVLNPKVALPLTLKKLGQMTYQSPRFATGTGMLLNNIGSSNIWDNVLRQYLMRDAKEKR